MKRTKTLAAALLAAAMPLSGCATTHLRGQYRTDVAEPTSMRKSNQLLAKGSEWPLFWGIFEVGKYDVNKDLNKKLRPDEAINHLEIRDRVSIGGVFLWIITAGIVSHHTVEVRGQPTVISRPPAETGTSAAPVRGERETIVVPATPVPSGYERDRDLHRPDKSADYNEGFQDGMRDRGLGAGAKDKSFRSDKSSDYNAGYRDALKDSSRKD